MANISGVGCGLMFDELTRIKMVYITKQAVLLLLTGWAMFEWEIRFWPLILILLFIATSLTVVETQSALVRKLKVIQLQKEEKI